MSTQEGDLYIVLVKVNPADVVPADLQPGEGIVQLLDPNPSDSPGHAEWSPTQGPALVRALDPITVPTLAENPTEIQPLMSPDPDSQPRRRTFSQKLPALVHTGLLFAIMIISSVNLSLRDWTEYCSVSSGLQETELMGSLSDLRESVCDAIDAQGSSRRTASAGYYCGRNPALSCWEYTYYFCSDPASYTGSSSGNICTYQTGSGTTGSGSGTTGSGSGTTGSDSGTTGSGSGTTGSGSGTTGSGSGTTGSGSGTTGSGSGTTGSGSGTTGSGSGTTGSGSGTTGSGSGTTGGGSGTTGSGSGTTGSGSGTTGSGSGTTGSGTGTTGSGSGSGATFWTWTLQSKECGDSCKNLRRLQQAGQVMLAFGIISLLLTTLMCIRLGVFLVIRKNLFHGLIEKIAMVVAAALWLVGVLVYIAIFISVRVDTHNVDVEAGLGLAIAVVVLHAISCILSLESVAGLVT